MEKIYTQKDIEQIFKEIDTAINLGLSKALCNTFMENYNYIKGYYLK